MPEALPVPGAPPGMASPEACVPTSDSSGWCVRTPQDCAARCALEVEYSAELRGDAEEDSENSFSFQASVTVVNNRAFDTDTALRAWQATWAFANGEGVKRNAVFATDTAVLVSPGGPNGQPARLVNALGESGSVSSNGGRKSFAFTGVSANSNDSPLNTIVDVTLNGMTCGMVLGATSEVNDFTLLSQNASKCSLPGDNKLFRFCCGEEIVSTETSLGVNGNESKTSSIERVLLTIAVVFLALGLVVIVHLVRKKQKENSTCLNTTRKTTRMLPGQFVSESFVDVQGVVVGKSGVVNSSNGVPSSVRTMIGTDTQYVPSPSPARLDTTSRDTNDEDDSSVSSEDESDETSIPEVALASITFGETLGQGAYGVVRAGVWRRQIIEGDGGTSQRTEIDEDANLQSTPVAVKTIHASFGTNPSRRALRAFAREVAVLSRLKHPNVVRLLGACLTPPRVCIVEELVHGGSLHAFLHDKRLRVGDENKKNEKTRRSNLTLLQTIDVCGGVARAMAYLAHNGVVHRDLKTQNVLLVIDRDTKIKAKVADFGIAKSLAVSESETQTGWTVGAVTGGGAAGTPAWMAPELFRDTPVADSAADVYSFGVVLWECLTGKTPWSWLADPIQIVFAVAVEGKRLPLGVDFFETRDDDKNGADNVATRCGPTLRDLLNRCFAEDPGGRPRFQEISKVFRGL